MWRWRDWVIDAFNRNMPYDQFTVEQLAGDLLPNATLDQRIATGFNRNHRTTGEGGIIPEEYRVEYVADRAQTTATVWLGLTVGCARCHDHKYDPIAQKDFYRLFAYFNQVPDERGFVWNYGNEEPFVKAPLPEQQQHLAELDAQIAAHRAQLRRAPAETRHAQGALESDAAHSAPDWTPDRGLVIPLATLDGGTFEPATPPTSTICDPVHLCRLDQSRAPQRRDPHPPRRLLRRPGPRPVPDEWQAPPAHHPPLHRSRHPRRNRRARQAEPVAARARHLRRQAQGVGRPDLCRWRAARDEDPVRSEQRALPQEGHADPRGRGRRPEIRRRDRRRPHLQARSHPRRKRRRSPLPETLAEIAAIPAEQRTRPQQAKLDLAFLETAAPRAIRQATRTRSNRRSPPATHSTTRSPPSW